MQFALRRQRCFGVASTTIQTSTSPNWRNIWRQMETMSQSHTAADAALNGKAVGLIGVGLLGSTLADRLIDKGIAVRGFDTNEDRLRVLTHGGGIACHSGAEVVQRCDVLFLSLPSSDKVLALVQQLRRSFKSGQIVLDTTTGDPEQMIAVGHSLAELGVHYIETTSQFFSRSSRPLRRRS